MKIQEFQLLLKKEIGTEVHWSAIKMLEPQKTTELKNILGALYPYYTSKQELPLGTWGYLYDPKEEKKAIFWPPSIEYFEQFARFLNQMGVIGNFRKIPKEVNGQRKTETVCTKLMNIQPVPQKLERPAPGEE